MAIQTRLTQTGWGGRPYLGFVAKILFVADIEAKRTINIIGESRSLPIIGESRALSTFGESRTVTIIGESRTVKPLKETE